MPAAIEWWQAPVWPAPSSTLIQFAGSQKGGRRQLEQDSGSAATFRLE